jgi:hypothetical protein
MIHVIAALLTLFLVPLLLVIYWNDQGFGKWGLAASWFGNFLNMVALVCNGFQMPVVGYFIYPETLWKSGVGARLPWICDRFPVPHVGICSIGDFIIYAGAGVTLAWIVRRVWRAL